MLVSLKLACLLYKCTLVCLQQVPRRITVGEVPAFMNWSGPVLAGNIVPRVQERSERAERAEKCSEHCWA